MILWAQLYLTMMSSIDTDSLIYIGEGMEMRPFASLDCSLVGANDASLFFSK